MTNIREAIEGDIDRIVLVINSAFRVESFFVEGDRIDSKTVSKLLQSGKFLLIEGGSKLVGCVYVELRGESGYLGLLSVDPSCQRSGIGRQLVDAAEAYFREAGCQFVELQVVNVREELPPFYRKLGYTESGTAPFPTEVKTKLPCHFITMCKRIV